MGKYVHSVYPSASNLLFKLEEIKGDKMLSGLLLLLLAYGCYHIADNEI